MRARLRIRGVAPSSRRFLRPKKPANHAASSFAVFALMEPNGPHST
jgi:hypothetical protein